jgi:hypothetical protein
VLLRALQALSVQTAGRGAFEVLLVQASPTDAALASVRGFEAVPVRATRAPAQGPAAWRHAAAEAAGEIVLFLDADRVAGPALIAEHEAAHLRLPDARIAVTGATEVDPSLASDPLPQIMDEARHGTTRAKRGDRLPEASFRLCGTSLKRAFLLDGGEWARTFPEGCEEAELGWRLARRGLELVHEPAAVTALARPMSFDDLCAAAHRQGHADLAYARAHPEAGRSAAVAGAREQWKRIAPVYAALLRSARELDRLSRLRRSAGLGVRDVDMTLVRRGYWTAFRSCRIRATAEPDAPPPSSA